MPFFQTQINRRLITIRDDTELLFDTFYIEVYYCRYICFFGFLEVDLATLVYFRLDSLLVKLVYISK